MLGEGGAGERIQQWCSDMDGAREDKIGCGRNKEAESTKCLAERGRSEIQIWRWL